jgi:hypothetical protein
MVGMTLVEIREHVEALATDDGDYYVVCGRTGDRPVPAAGHRFEGRATARSAARATEQYRSALRRYDPRVPYYDLIVCQDARPVSPADQPPREGAYQSLSEPVLRAASPQPERRELGEFCHRVAAAVFEALSGDGYGSVETAVMDAYFELAETVAGPNALCLCLLESIAGELDARLRPTDQADVVTSAAARLGADPAAEPLAATLARLENRGLIRGYTRSPWAGDHGGGPRSAVVRLSEYALSPRRGRLPVLPIVLDLARRQPAPLPSSLHAVERDGGWEVTLVRAGEGEPSGLASAPIHAGT